MTHEGSAMGVLQRDAGTVASGLHRLPMTPEDAGVSHRALSVRELVNGDRPVVDIDRRLPGTVSWCRS
jgi:hypothetical protein